MKLKHLRKSMRSPSHFRDRDAVDTIHTIMTIPRKSCRRSEDWSTRADLASNGHPEVSWPRILRGLIRQQVADREESRQPVPDDRYFSRRVSLTVYSKRCYPVHGFSSTTHFGFRGLRRGHARPGRHTTAKGCTTERARWPGRIIHVFPQNRSAIALAQ